MVTHPVRAAIHTNEENLALKSAFLGKNTVLNLVSRKCKNAFIGLILIGRCGSSAVLRTMRQPMTNSTARSDRAARIVLGIVVFMDFMDLVSW